MNALLSAEREASEETHARPAVHNLVSRSRLTADELNNVGPIYGSPGA